MDHALAAVPLLDVVVECALEGGCNCLVQRFLVRLDSDGFGLVGHFRLLILAVRISNGA